MGAKANSSKAYENGGGVRRAERVIESKEKAGNARRHCTATRLSQQRKSSQTYPSSEGVLNPRIDARLTVGRKRVIRRAEVPGLNAQPASMRRASRGPVAGRRRHPGPVLQSSGVTPSATRKRATML
jgi:hypothetical protein